MPSPSAVDLESLAGATVHSRLDAIGTGPYQILLMLCIGTGMLTDSLEMGALAPMHTALSHSFGLSHAARDALPAMIFAGSACGLAIAAPLGDRYGRKGTILISLASIVTVMLLTASLPTTASPWMILAVRFAAGAAGSVPVPAGYALAVESCPRDSRASIVFGMGFLGCVGYIVASVGVKMFMPHFGEDDADDWRVFCVFTAAVSALSIPLVMLLHESPCFLAVKGDAEGCVLALDGIAQWNSKPPLNSFQLPEVPPLAQTRGEGDWYSKVVTMFADVSPYVWLIILLSVIDSCRGFFVSGSSYLWKDLFYQIESAFEENPVSQLSPANLNIVASLSPLVGMLIGERVVYMGVRRVAFLSSLVAMCALVTLTRSGIREAPLSLLACVMVVKMTYGPLSTCVILMKTEAFPTAARVSAFSVISIASKFFCALSPTVIEALKGSEEAASWSDASLTRFLFALALTVVSCGGLALKVPGRDRDGSPLAKDPQQQKIDMPVWRPYGSTLTNGAAARKA